jgi:hypothetical protein
MADGPWCGSGSSWWAARSGDIAEEGERTLAVGTGEGFGRREFQGDLGRLAEEAAEEVSVLFGSSSGEAVVAHSGEPFG